MPKKKTSAKKTVVKQVRKNPLFRKFYPMLLLLIGIAAGLLLAWLQPPDYHPKSLVWASDKTVTIPNDLSAYLQKRNDCTTYRGKNNPPGVSLWAVYQTSKSKFAKVSYGCSTRLTTYAMVVKDGASWTLLDPSDYFANRAQTTGSISSFLPKCTFIDKYHIDKSIEPFCVEVDGSAHENKLQ